MEVEGTWLNLLRPFNPTTSSCSNRLEAIHPHAGKDEEEERTSWWGDWKEEVIAVEHLHRKKLTWGSRQCSSSFAEV